MTTADAPRREQLARTLEALHRAREERDPVAAAAVLTEDVVHVMPSSFVPEPKVGRDTVAAGLTTGVSDYFQPDTMRREIVRTTIEGEVAAVEQILRCRTKDGRPYENVYVWIYEFRDGLICRMTEHADTLRAARMFAGE